MRIRYYLLFLLLMSAGSMAFGEGSKELNANGVKSTGLHICTDIANHCVGTNGPLLNFATYEANEVDRLYFQVAGTNEVVYMGFKGVNSGSSSRRIVYQIRDNVSGILVQAEQDLPTMGAGFISNLQQAISGPNQLILPPNPVTGYDALVFIPPGPGIYYIEFTLKNFGTNLIYRGTFNIDLFDITVGDTAAGIAKPGRLYSKSWQFTETNRFFGTNYILTDDGIVFSTSFNNLRSAIWSQYCNEFGCVNTGNLYVDRKSVYHMQSHTPQFRIFLNNPDPQLFPVSSTLGQIIGPDPWYEQNCTTGGILFHVNVNKPGKVQLELTFSGEYQPKIMLQSVSTGENLITWDGYDGSYPAAIPVSNNTTIAFIVKFLDGLTNMLLYDAEMNYDGFTISLVNPPGPAPAVFWDDSNIPMGGNNSLPPGCVSPPGCHVWSGSINGLGDRSTINSWWYLPSSASFPVQITHYRMPQELSLQQPQLLDYCMDTSAHVLSVLPDPNTDQYHWSYFPPDGVTISQATPDSPEINLFFGLGATSGTLSVYGTNTNCPIPGQTLSVPVALFTGVPSQPGGQISGDTIVIPGQTDVSYMIDSIPNATGYTWILPVGASVTSGANSNHITVDFANDAISGPISVFGTNPCGSGPGTASQTITVSSYVQLTSFTVDAMQCSNDSVLFIPFTPAPGIVQEIWDYGDGTSDTIVGPIPLPFFAKHKFPMTGVFFVTRTVTYITNHMESHGINIETKPPPVANFFFHPDSLFSTSNACQNHVIYFVDASLSGSTGPNSTIVSWRWNFDDGTPANYSSGTVLHTYNNPGNYNVKLYVINGFGCADSIIKSVEVLPLPAAPGPVEGPVSVCVSATGVLYMVNPVLNSESYHWTIPVGTSITGGAGTNAIFLDFPVSPVAGIMSVKPLNGCGEGPVSPPLPISSSTQLTGQLNFNNVMITQGQQRCHSVQNITAGGNGTGFIIENGGWVTLIASQNILLLPGSVVQSGGYLHAFTTDLCVSCSTSASLNNKLGVENLKQEVLSSTQVKDDQFFKCYPNPTTGSFTFELSSVPARAPVNVACYNLLGSMILEKTIISGKQCEINLTGHMPGIYLLRITHNGETGIMKIIKQ